MDHGPAVTLGTDNATKKKTKLGLILFFVYSLIYIGFVTINIVNPKIMETIIIFGLNLAIVYGFSLILFAIILGIVYNYVCTKWEDLMNKEEGGEK